MSSPPNPVLIPSRIEGARHTNDGRDVTLRDVFIACVLIGGCKDARYAVEIANAALKWRVE